MSELWIPRRLPGLNDLLENALLPKVGHRAYASLKKSVQERVQFCALTQRFKVVGKHWTILFAEENRRRDPDNVISGGTKLVFDALRKCGVLENDGWAHVESITPFWALASQRTCGVFLINGDRPASLDWTLERYMAKSHGIHGEKTQEEDRERQGASGDAALPPAPQRAARRRRSKTGG